MKKIVLIISLLATTVSYAFPQFDCHGNEPFWGLKLYTNNFVFTREQQDTHLKTVPASQQGNSYTFNTKTSNGQAVTIVIKKEKCSDGMSDISYPYSVSYSGADQPYSGCCKVVKNKSHYKQ